MKEEINRIAKEIEQDLVARRRDFHRHAESGWLEFRTASLVARRLFELGYEVQAGRKVVYDGERQGLPPAQVLEEGWQHARAQGGDPEFLELVRGGYTGVVGILRGGPGPTIGLRFDMDAIELAESLDPDHRPAREGFVSANPEATHACGHDAHTSVGLGVAEVLVRLREQIKGTVKLIFQPAEEGVRGARAMVTAGVVDDVDYLLGFHLYSGWEVGQIDPGRSGFLATTKFDAFLHGMPAHAGGVPNQGKNALMAAATAVLNLQAIPRHRDGKTRINVGRLMAGSGRNVIPATAHLVIETRGATTELNSYMFDNAVRILEASAAMHDCSLKIKAMGSAQSADSDPKLISRVRDVVLESEDLLLREPEPSGGSEDFTFMMTRVQERGGLATNIGIGADLGGWGHHTAEFDLDERALRVAVRLLSAVVLDIFEAPIL